MIKLIVIIAIALALLPVVAAMFGLVATGIMMYIAAPFSLIGIMFDLIVNNGRSTLEDMVNPILALILGTIATVAIMIALAMMGF
jgi:hypothetical protein